MPSSWGDLVRGGNAARCAVVGGGMMLQAINTFIAVTVLPSVVRDIGGLDYFAWATTLYVIAGLLGGSLCARLLAGAGTRNSYRLALSVFALGAATCALAPDMPVLLAGRLIQGYGGGTMSALSFTMVRVLFPQPLWSRAFSVISATWGIATLAGPAVGGVFAEFGAWRMAFATMAVACPFLLLLVELSLPRGMARALAAGPPIAYASLAWLIVSVLAISVGSMSERPIWNAAGVAAALASFAGFVGWERSGRRRLLPDGATRFTTPLGATYIAMAVLLMSVNVEIFVPYFLQTLHGMSPLHAGYLTAIMSASWTAGSVISSSMASDWPERALRVGPLAGLAGLLGLLLLVPGGSSGAAIVAIGAAMALLGFGVGICWPQLGARVFAYAAAHDRDLAAASITVVIGVTYSFGSALGGMVTRLGGLTDPGGVAGAASAAIWLFTSFAVTPVLAMAVLRRLLRFPLSA